MSTTYNPVSRASSSAVTARASMALKRRTGRAPYADDEICERNYPGLLHARVLRCPYPRARITHLDTTKPRRCKASRRS